jgi:hypothetical protein
LIPVSSGVPIADAAAFDGSASVCIFPITTMTRSKKSRRLTDVDSAALETTSAFSWQSARQLPMEVERDAIMQLIYSKIAIPQRQIACMTAFH